MKRLFLLAAALTAAACASSAASPVLQARGLDELSGLQAAHRHAGFWGHNDSGDTARLFRIGSAGEDLGTVAVHGAGAVDWEDLAGFTAADGTPMLLIADVGDNQAVRRSVTLYALPEPGPEAVSVDVAWSLRFRYPDGPRDAEAVAVTPARPGHASEVLILSKRDRPPRLYRLPLAASADEAIVAEFLTELRSLPAGAGIPDQPTAMDLSMDGRSLLVLTYQRVFLWRRIGDEPWAEAMARAPEQLDRPALRQAEAITLLADGRRYAVSSEQRPAPLWVLSLPD